MKDIFKLLRKELPGIKKRVLLKDYTTFKIGGPAEYFLIAKEQNSLIKAIKVAKKFNLPIFILGGGSNLLISDNGFNGLAIKIKFTKWSIKTKNIIVSDPGVEMKDLVRASLNKGLRGLEWAGGLPGTFGGAIRGNAGAFGGEIKDSILEVKALDNNLKIRKLSNKQCEFSYRSSIFKEKNWVIISAKIKFTKGIKKELITIANSHIKYRKERHPLEYPNAGSIFKGVDFKKIPKELQKEFLDKVKKDPFDIVPAAFFIIGAGLTGRKIGQAQISKKHSNYIINLGNAKAIDILKLIDIVKDEVKKKYKVDLEVEVQNLGF